MEDGRLRADHYREAFYVSNKDRIDAIKSKKNIGFIADLIGGMRASNQKEFKMYGVSIGQDQFQDALWLYLNDQEKYGDNSDFEINGWFLINICIFVRKLLICNSGLLVLERFKIGLAYLV